MWVLACFWWCCLSWRFKLGFGFSSSTVFWFLPCSMSLGGIFSHMQYGPSSSVCVCLYSCTSERRKGVTCHIFVTAHTHPAESSVCTSEDTQIHTNQFIRAHGLRSYLASCWAASSSPPKALGWDTHTHTAVYNDVKLGAQFLNFFMSGLLAFKLFVPQSIVALVPTCWKFFAEIKFRISIWLQKSVKLLGNCWRQNLHCL